MGDDAADTENRGMWTELRVKYIKKKLFSTFPKLLAGPKFDKAFEVDENS